MSRHPYTEDQLVEQPAIGLFATLGWQTVSALEETFAAGGTLGRETKGEVVLVERLRTALGKFNPALPPEAISNAVDELTHAFATVVNSLPEAYIRYSRIANEGAVRWPARNPTRKSYCVRRIWWCCCVWSWNAAQRQPMQRWRPNWA